MKFRRYQNRAGAWALNALIATSVVAVGCDDDDPVTGSTDSGSDATNPSDAGVDSTTDTSGALTLESLLARERQSLRDQVGESEQVDLDVYLVDFPTETRAAVEQAITARLRGLEIVDTKPWWIPRIPLFRAAEFDLRPAPDDLPPELTPPDGMIRYEGSSMTRQDDPVTGRTTWVPNRETNEVVDDWHQNVDIVNYVEHDGAFTGVAWEVGDVTFHHLAGADIASLRSELEASETEYVSAHPAQTFSLYSYNTLFDWLDREEAIAEKRGGATLVFVNFDGLDSDPYSFYIDSTKDAVPLQAVAPSEVQYPEVTAADPSYQPAADLMNGALRGGLTQAKMMAALEVVCDEVADESANIPGAQPGQTLCAQWRLDPIVNLLGNRGRRYFVSDATRLLTELEAGESDVAGTATKLADNAFELYRFGVLQTSLKANNAYSQAYEARVLTVDLRYDATEMCILDKLENSDDPMPCLNDSSGYETEQTYELSDVFDVELAKNSLQEFIPAQWRVTTVPFPFGQMPDGTVDRIAGAQAKAGLRANLNEPQLPNPNGGDPIPLRHPPLYRTLQFPNTADTLTSSWEFGVDPNVALAAFSRDQAEGGLGVYDLFWPEAKVRDEDPYHETGEENVKPLLFVMTPPPSGPRGEKWGTFPYNTTLWALAGLNTTWGGGGWWGSVAGNEQGGAIMRRDFFFITPQYFLGKHRGNGDALPMGVMPDGTVEPNEGFADLTRRALDIGTIHWVDQFDDPDPDRRALARNFVREVSTLQAIETLQHGLGYMHAPEPRKRFHFDGQTSTIERHHELAANPTDVVGNLLHLYVNQYTTHGVSTVWGQCTSEWNGVAPQTGMQLTLFRSHAREAIADAELQLNYTLQQAEAAESVSGETLQAIDQAMTAHNNSKELYAAWEYKDAVRETWQILSQLDAALTLLGEPDRIHDPQALSFPSAP